MASVTKSNKTFFFNVCKFIWHRMIHQTRVIMVCIKEVEASHYHHLIEACRSSSLQWIFLTYNKPSCSKLTPAGLRTVHDKNRFNTMPIQDLSISIVPRKIASCVENVWDIPTKPMALCSPSSPASIKPTSISLASLLSGLAWMLILFISQLPAACIS